MDDRIFPGLISFDKRIMAAVRQYLKFGEFYGNTRRSDFLAYRNTSWFLIKKLNPDMSTKEMGQVFGKDHSTFVTTRSKFLNLYEGNSLFYTFIFNDIQCVLKYKKSVGMDRLISDMISHVSVAENEKRDAKQLLSTRSWIIKKVENRAIASIVAFFMRHQVSSREICIYLNAKPKQNGVQYPSFKGINTHIEEIEKLVEGKIKYLKRQLKNENRPIVN